MALMNSLQTTDLGALNSKPVPAWVSQLRQQQDPRFAYMRNSGPQAGLQTGPQTGGWGIGQNGGVVWNGRGPAPGPAPTLQELGLGASLMSPTGAVGMYQPGGQAYQRGMVSTQPVAGGTQWAGNALSGAVPQVAQAPSQAAWQNQPAGTSGYTTSSPTMAPGAPQYGLSGAENALQRGLTGALAGLEGGVNAATGTLNPYTQGGGAAYNLQAALSGALGPQAQAQAFANYQQSPEQQYLRDRSEQAILRNASATGNLRSGNVLRALQENAIGLAAQDYGNAFNRLGSLSNMGLGASGQLAGIQAGAGNQAGNWAYGTGGNLANLRTRAGEQIAGNLQGTSQSLANMINQQGSDLSSLIGKTGGDIANLLSAYGQTDALTLQDMAKVLANIATGSGSQVQGLPGLPQAGEGGLLPALADIGQGAGTAYMAYTMSDARLKTNIQKIGKLRSGQNLYSWDWNDEGKRIAGNQPTVGVMAHETDPSHVTVGPHGYLMVDYSGLL